MKLPIAARDHLRRILAEHPEIEKHCSSRDDVVTLEKPALLRLARKLAIDVKSIIKQTQQKSKGRPEAFYEEQEIADHIHADKYPPFNGAIEFDFTFAAFGIECVRKARLIWEWTPMWPYYDLHKQQVVTMPSGGSMELEICAVPDVDTWEQAPTGRWKNTKGKPAWVVANQLLAEGVLPRDIMRQFDEEIERRCDAEDRKRRALHGVPGETT